MRTGRPRILRGYLGFACAAVDFAYGSDDALWAASKWPWATFECSAPFA